ncbi:hypothetical protein CPC16_002837 [Podila verticillata]|nr:hypothetical protein CPC16_002837 [Podila verticillata]KAI9242266.1 MAG: kinase-like domain-containing protein [Podila humilis]KFH72166.1 AGC/YANK protein kinase [Podila verticillata NRRL 6337]
MGVACCKEEAIDFTGEIELSHFHLLRSVGKGAFGKVRVVQHKKTKEIYALKYINKAKCIRMRAVENIIQERRLLEEVEFSLICNLRYAFQDDENLFMVLDLMLGGDLRFHLERAGPMREDVVRFYVAELALALDALHTRRIVHRDLKPDNVLLDEHGHAHLTDFNIAVYYHPSKPLMSIAGSMAYMAPEVLLRKGYFESVDWWSLGVVMFELLFGRRPFRGKSNDLLTNSILRDPLPFPENVHDMISAPCLDVLSRLCERDISKRLGCTSDGLDAFKNHPWFDGMEWDKLVTKEATPPFEPDSKRANFDATHELEELLMEDNPLKAKKRAQTSPETELSIEMQLMEDKFIIYDFTKVKRSHSLNRGKIMRTGTSGTTNAVGADLHKINSTSTLDGTLVATRNSTGRIEQLPMMGAPPPKIPRPESPSDRVGQDRFNPDEDKLSLISTDLSHRTGSKNEVTQTQAQNPRVSIYRLQEKAEEAEDEAVVMLPAATAISVDPRPFSQVPLSGSPDQLPQNPLIQQHQRQHYANSTTPSSPSHSSGHSSLSTPPTTHNSSPATQKLGAAGTALFSAPDSGASLSSITPSGTPLMDTASIFNQASRPRPRGRQGQFNSSSPSPLSHAHDGTLATTRSSQPYSTPLIARSGRSFEILASTQQQQHASPARPMSAYTTSHAAHDEGFQETKSLTMAYIPTSLSNGFQTPLGIGLEGFNETPANVTEDAYIKHNNVYKTRGAKDQEPKGEKRALAEDAQMQTVLV